MRFLKNNVFKYFMNTFYTSKYNNKISSFLRLHFERNNYTIDFFSTLGNTYKNSKWSDLKIQNIKLTHIYSFIKFFFILFFCFTLLLTLINYNYINLKKFVFPLNSTILLLNELFIYILTIFLFYFIKLFNTYFFFNSKNEFLSYKNTIYTKNVKFNYNFKQNNNINLNYYNFYKSLYLTLKKIQYTNLNISDLNSKSSLNNLSNNSFLIKNSDIFLESQINEFLINNFSKSNILTSNVLNDLNKLNINNNQVNILYDNFLKNSNEISKQERWMLKNNTISNNLVNSLNKNILIKQFLGNPLEQNDISLKNIWISSKNYMNMNQLLSNNNFNYNWVLNQNKLYNNTNVIDFFEKSRIFFEKKNVFTTSSFNNLLSLDNNNYNSNILNIHNNNNLQFDFYSLILFYDFEKNVFTFNTDYSINDFNKLNINFTPSNNIDFLYNNILNDSDLILFYNFNNNNNTHSSNYYNLL